MNNLLCHTGRTFTLDGLDDRTKAAQESIISKLTEALEDGAEDKLEEHDTGL